MEDSHRNCPRLHESFGKQRSAQSAPMAARSISRRCLGHRIASIDVRPRRSFRCQSTLPCESSRPAGALVVLVAVQLSVRWDCICRQCSSHGVVVESAPDDHFTASPHCRVIQSAIRRVGGAGGNPTVGSGIVSPPVLKVTETISAPNDHFAAGPDCRVLPGGGRVVGAGRCPTVCAGIVSPAGVQIRRT